MTFRPVASVTKRLGTVAGQRAKGLLTVRYAEACDDG